MTNLEEPSKSTSVAPISVKSTSEEVIVGEPMPGRAAEFANVDAPTVPDTADTTDANARLEEYRQRLVAFSRIVRQIPTQTDKEATYEQKDLPTIHFSSDTSLPTPTEGRPQPDAATRPKFVTGGRRVEPPVTGGRRVEPPPPVKSSTKKS